MQETNPDGYRIDYDNPDVVDLIAQIRQRVRRDQSAPRIPPKAREKALRERLRTYLDLDEQRPYDLQKTLHLEGTWNVSPEDLRRSGRQAFGRLIALARTLAGPVMKLGANLDLPLYKQFKINLGVAEALNDLLRQTSDLQVRVEELASRLDRLEQRAGRGTSPSSSDGADDGGASG
ncbi:MAG: hypothetical protein ACE5HV_09020 [Acidobacteriota bacterium]